MAKTVRYQEKQRQGLVPHRYDRDSRSFNLGAWKHWPEDRRSPVARRMENNDRQVLKIGRERRG